VSGQAAFAHDPNVPNDACSNVARHEKGTERAQIAKASVGVRRPVGKDANFALEGLQQKLVDGRRDRVQVGDARAARVKVQVRIRIVRGPSAEMAEDLGRVMPDDRGGWIEGNGADRVVPTAPSSSIVF